MTCGRLPTARAGVGPVQFTNFISRLKHTSKCYHDLKLILAFARQLPPPKKIISQINDQLLLRQLSLSWDGETGVKYHLPQNNFLR